MKRCVHAAFFMTLSIAFLSAVPLFAQDSTPTPSPEIIATMPPTDTPVTITPEVTDEATPEVTAEPTAEETAEMTPEITATFDISPSITVTPTRTPLSALPGSGNFTVQQPFGGLQRTYRIHIPESYDTNDDLYPLVFALHGAGGDGANMEYISEFGDLAEREGFIVVYPDGVNGGWNDGRPIGGQPINDAAFLAAITQYLGANMRIDLSRVYSTGYSMGGMMSLRLGCLLPDVFAAVAAVATTMPAYILEECVEATPMPIMIIQGTDDGVVPWVGVRGGYLSARDSVRMWKQVNHCIGRQVIEPMEDVDPDDGTRTLIETYTECEDGSEVTLISVLFGGHTWSGTSAMGGSGLGLTSQDFSASEMIWEFFSRHANEPA